MTAGNDAVQPERHSRGQNGYRPSYQGMATNDARTGDRHGAGATESRIERLGRRRDEFETVGLILGIVGVLLIVVVTVGAGTRF